MSSKRKPMGDKNSKESHHHSKRHKSKRSNKGEFLEPVYFIDSMLLHSNNVPLFFPTSYGSPQPTWNVVTASEQIKPTSTLHKKLGHYKKPAMSPLYLVPEGRLTNENPVILEGVQSYVINKNWHIPNEKPSCFNEVGENYLFSKRNEAVEVNNTKKSNRPQYYARNILIDTPTQYEYELRSSNRTSHLSNRQPQEKSGGTSETNTTNHTNEPDKTWDELSESWNDSLILPDRQTPEGLLVMRVMDGNESNANKGFYDFNSPPRASNRSSPSTSGNQPTEASEVHHNLRWSNETTGITNEPKKKLSFELPVEINDSDSEERRNNGLRYSHRQMKIKPGGNYRRSYSKIIERGKSSISTEASINELNRKNNDIQSSLVPAPDYHFLAREVGNETRYNQKCIGSRELICNDRDKVVSECNTITRGISPIHLRFSEDTGCCCSRNISSCCYGCGRAVVEKGLCSPNSKHDFHSPTERSNEFTECSDSYRGQGGNPHNRTCSKIRFSQTNTALKPNVELHFEHFPPTNDISIVIDQGTQGTEYKMKEPCLPLNEFNACSVPMKEIHNRSCHCIQNNVANLYTKSENCYVPNEMCPNGFPNVELCTSIPLNYCPALANTTLSSFPDQPPIYENQCRCDSNEETEKETRSGYIQKSKTCNPLQGSQTSFDRFGACSSNLPVQCHCDFNRDIYNIMSQIEDNIILKLERKGVFEIDKVLESSPEDIKTNKRSVTVQSGESNINISKNLLNKFEEQPRTMSSKGVTESYTITENNGSEKQPNTDLNRQNFSNKFNLKPPERENSEYNIDNLSKISRNYISAKINNNDFKVSEMEKTKNSETSTKETQPEETKKSEIPTKETQPERRTSPETPAKTFEQEKINKSNNSTNESELVIRQISESPTKESELEEKKKSETPTIEYELQERKKSETPIKESELGIRKKSDTSTKEYELEKRKKSGSHTKRYESKKIQNLLTPKKESKLEMRKISETPSGITARSSSPRRKFKSSNSLFVKREKPFFPSIRIKKYSKKEDIPKFRDQGTIPMSVFSAMPTFNNYFAQCYNESNVSKNLIPNDVLLKNGKHQQNELKNYAGGKNGKLFNSCKVRKINLSKSKKNVFILVKKRSEKRKASSKKTISNSMLKTKSRKVFWLK